MYPSLESQFPSKSTSVKRQIKKPGEVSKWSEEVSSKLGVYKGETSIDDTGTRGKLGDNLFFSTEVAERSSFQIHNLWSFEPGSSRKSGSDRILKCSFRSRQNDGTFQLSLLQASFQTDLTKVRRRNLESIANNFWMRVMAKSKRWRGKMTPSTKRHDPALYISAFDREAEAAISSLFASPIESSCLSWVLAAKRYWMLLPFFRNKCYM